MADLIEDHQIEIEMKFSTKDYLDRLLEDMDLDELLEVIKYIDKEICDIEFTSRAGDYFNEEIEKDNEENDDSFIEKEDLDVTTTLAIIKGIIVATHKNKTVINGILDYIQEIEDAD